MGGIEICMHPKDYHHENDGSGARIAKKVFQMSKFLKRYGHFEIISLKDLVLKRENKGKL